MNLPRAIYWISTALLCLLLLFSAITYFVNHDDVAETFRDLGYPSYLIYPLALAKVAAIVAILTNKSRFLKNLAYAGVFYNFLLAFVAHAIKADGAGIFAFVGIIFLVLSYLLNKVLYPRKKSGFDL